MMSMSISSGSSVVSGVCVLARTMPVEVVVQESLGCIHSVNGINSSSGSHDVELSLLELMSGPSKLFVAVVEGIAVVKRRNVRHGVSSHVDSSCGQIPSVLLSVDDLGGQCLVVNMLSLMHHSSSHFVVNSIVVSWSKW